MRIAYFDCIAGIAGDMTLAALIDAGADADELRAGLARLPIEPFELEVEEVDQHGIGATHVEVRTTAAGIIRTYSSIRALLDAADLPEETRHRAQRIFRRLAEAEARIHRKEIELVTFHEVGAVDSIVDIVGASLALTMLGVERVLASPVPTGMGMTRTDHGAMPIPPPAVVELLRGAPMYSMGVPFELTTPTGAAILAATAEGYGDMPRMRIGSAGYGAGTHRLEFPNVLRVVIGEMVEEASGSGDARSSDEVLLETNVDDVSPEVHGFLLERLLTAGAQDAWLASIVMKKGRPAVTVSVLCAPEQADTMRAILFQETGTLGVRTTRVSKMALERQTIKVETPFGVVGVKVGMLGAGPVSVSPEYEDCARLAREADVPLRQVYEEALRLARERLAGSITPPDAPLGSSAGTPLDPSPLDPS